MKKYNIILISLFLACSLLQSCSDWLHIIPETQLTEKDLTSTSDGYRSQLNGLYNALSAPMLYGMNLSFQFIDLIGQQHTMDAVSIYSPAHKDIKTTQLDYQHFQVRPIINEIWASGYNLIANANFLIRKVEQEDSLFFKERGKEKKLILGEAYACRAFMHFDLLRLFAPAPINDDGSPYIPYVDKYPDLLSPEIPVQLYLDKVISDLEKAKKLVAEYDTTLWGKGLLIDKGSRFFNRLVFGTEPYGKTFDDFFKGRGYRLNYYAITALLARVYNYKGEYEKAYLAADEVMKLQVKDYTNWRSAFDYDDYTGARRANAETKSEVRIPSNLIFAAYEKNAYDRYNLYIYFCKSFFSGSVPRWYSVRKEFFLLENGYDEYNDDYRGKDMTFLAFGSYGSFPLSVKYYLSDNETLRDENLQIIPLIRSTEMKYIIAEYFARNENFSEAQKIINNIRQNRGCREEIHITNLSDFITELIRDARREYITEGQMFYLYKRLNTDVNFGGNIIRPYSRVEYLLPIPDDQSL